MKILSIKIPEPLLVKLNSAAKERGESRSAIVRQAIEAFIEDEDHTPQGSCLELAKDLAGVVKGPADLSINKKHMRGYGQ
jgi:metal-responsive CopG/Arc/MetJ family transcriptional regulator